MRVKITKAVVDDVWRKSRGRGKAALLYDTEIRGFGARAAATGVSFFVEFRIGGRGGRNRRMTIGRLGELTVDEARKKAQKHRAAIIDGTDVMEARDETRRRAAGSRFDHAVERYLQLRSRKGRYWQEVERLLLSKDLERLQSRALTTITRAELVAILDRVAERSPSTARVLHAALRPFLAWCVPRGLIDTSPLDGVRPPAPVAARDRILDETEIGAFWQATGEFGFPFRQILRLLLLTGQRRSEVAGMRRSEVDVATGVWIIRAERTKNGKPHEVDLGGLALRVFQNVPQCEDDLFFTTTGSTAPSGFSKAKLRLDARMQELLGGECRPWRLHDLRRTAASGMASLGVQPHIVERVLNHVSGAQGGLVGVYQRYEYRDDRRSALAAWDDHVAALVGEADTGDNVIALSAHRVR